MTMTLTGQQNAVITTTIVLIKSSCVEGFPVPIPTFDDKQFQHSFSTLSMLAKQSTRP